MFDFFKNAFSSKPTLTSDPRIPYLTYTFNFGEQFGKGSKRVRFVLAPYSEISNFLLSQNMQAVVQREEQYITAKLDSFVAFKKNGRYVFIDKDNSISYTDDVRFFVDERVLDETSCAIIYDNLTGLLSVGAQQIRFTRSEVLQVLRKYGYRG